MTETEKRSAATKFYNDWRGIGDEKSDSQRFWIEFFSNVLGIEDVTKKIVFEKRVVVDGQTKFIDVYIPETRVLIEQKSIDKDLSKKAQQSDGTMRTPFEQGRNYAQWMIPNETPLWIVACNFKTFEIHDMNKPNEPATVIPLEEVRNKLPLFDFMFKKEVKELSHEMEISVKAGEIVGLLYDKLIVQYKEPDEQSFKSLNALCVRLVFCLYAEDAGIFGAHMMFHDYLKDIPVNGFRKALVELFKILDTKPEDRDKYLSEDNPKLAAFPYVNGGLFADETIEIPPFTEELKSLLLNKASADFDWSDISPTIFGAVFESTLNPETRRSGGMHYTSIENIHKVIDPLFMDELKAEFKEIKQISVERTKKSKLNAFQKKIAGLKFLDPACGSGNFLTETYISLRRLENEILNELQGGQIVLGEAINPIQVSISQFYGIEINDFAVTVAKTALWIAESQMMKETEDIVHMSLDFLPLKSYANIVEGNALRLDWGSVVSQNELNYIMGNPPFIGQQLRSKAQSSDMSYVFGQGTPETKLDYVVCWYKKSLEFMNITNGNRIKAAFVSTNSICQGESVPTFWKHMFDDGIDIVFAYKSFKWNSESNECATVVCVIVGFTNGNCADKKYLFENESKKMASHINAYLQDAPDIWITSRKNIPPNGFPKMVKGSEPTDGGNLFLNETEKNDLEKKYPQMSKYIKPFVGGDEYLSNKAGEHTRYCLWFEQGNPADYANISEIKNRLKDVAEKRLGSSADRIRKRAEYPYLFCQIRQPHTSYLLFPRHSSSERRYIPIGFMNPDIIVGDACYIIPDAPLFLFGVLTSNVHMAWTRLVCGRLGNGYRYSPAVYNNFPFPSLTEEQKNRISQTAQAILDARALYPNSSLAGLYDELLMPTELRKAHQQNDRAVMQAYGFSVKDTTEESCVAELMKMYQKIATV